MDNLTRLEKSFESLQLALRECGPDFAPVFHEVHLGDPKSQSDFSLKHAGGYSKCGVAWARDDDTLVDILKRIPIHACNDYLTCVSMNTTLYEDFTTTGKLEAGTIIAFNAEGHQNIKASVLARADRISLFDKFTVVDPNAHAPVHFVPFACTEHSMVDKDDEASDYCDSDDEPPLPIHGPLSAAESRAQNALMLLSVRSPRMSRKTRAFACSDTNEREKKRARLERCANQCAVTRK